MAKWWCSGANGIYLESLGLQSQVWPPRLLARAALYHKIQAIPRECCGSKVSVKDRAQGRIPAIVFSQSLMEKKPRNRSRGVKVVIAIGKCCQYHLRFDSFISWLYVIMAPKRNLGAQSKKGGQKVQSKRRSGSISAPDSKRRRTSRQQSKAAKESTKLPEHVSLSSPPYEMASNVPKERIIKDADVFKARVHSFSNPVDANKVIRSILTSSQLEMYRQTCFGHLLDLKNLRFSGHMMHNLLCRRVASNDPQVLEFNFGRARVRFTKWDFALISGLKFCKDPIIWSRRH